MVCKSSDQPEHAVIAFQAGLKWAPLISLLDQDNNFKAYVLKTTSSYDVAKHHALALKINLWTAKNELPRSLHSKGNHRMFPMSFKKLTFYILSLSILHHLDSIQL